MSFSLKLLGGALLEGPAGLVTGPAAQRHRLALLALLAGARTRSQSREKLMAWLWPEHDAARARALLNQAVHTLRRTLGAEAILSAGDELHLNPDVVNCDVAAFEEALAGRDLERAAALYTGPFLDGFFLSGAAEFQRWVDRERERLESLDGKVLEGLAIGAEATGDWTAAVAWWSSRATLDPYDSRIALRRISAMERGGNPAGALRYGLAHQQRLRDDLDLASDAAVAEALARLRQASADAQVATAPPQRFHQSVTEDAPTAPPAIADPRARRTGRLVITAAAIVILLAVLMRPKPGRSPDVAAGGSARVDEIAQAVARELERRGRGDTVSVLPHQRTRSVAAYELYLRGNDPALLRSDSAARRGVEYFDRAVALDSTYAAAWAGLARLRYRASQGEPISARPALRAQAEADARRAVVLDPDLGDGHAILGLFRTMARDFPAAEEHLRRAVTLEPARAGFREWLSNFYLLGGRVSDALAEAERAVALDPLSPTAHAELARALIANDRCDQAMIHLTRVLAVEPPLLRAAPLVAQCHGRMGHWPEALAAVRRQAARGDPLAMAFAAYAYARSGQRAQADSIQASLEKRVRRSEEGAYYLAFVPAALGNRDEAFNWLGRGLEDGSFGFPSGRSVPFTDPLFDDLKGDPRLEQLRARFLTPP